MPHRTAIWPELKILRGLLPWGVLAIALASCVLAGCNGDADWDGPAVARYPATGEGGDSALLEGTVHDMDGCLVITTRDSDTPTVPIFPDDDPAPDSLSEGDSVSLGGGFRERGQVEEYLPEACASGNLAYFQVSQEE